MSWFGKWDGFDEEMKNAPDIFARKPQTNYDRIISKSPDEMAKYLAPCACPPTQFNKNTGDIVCPVNKEPCESDCNSCWRDWLKREAATDE